MSTGPVGETNARGSLNELRGPRPIEPSIENLLVAITAKVELHSRLRVWAHEATRAGCPECVRLFKTLADSDRTQIDQLLAGLRHHLETPGGASSLSCDGLLAAGHAISSGTYERET
jgi:hypothetical protein